MPQNPKPNTDPKSLYVTVIGEVKNLQQQCQFTGVTFYEEWYEQYLRGEIYARLIYLGHSNLISSSTGPIDPDFS